MPTTTTTTEPWAGQKAYLERIFKEAERLYQANAPAFYSGKTVADFDPAQLLGQQRTLDYVADTAKTGGIQGQATQGLTNLFGMGTSPVYQQTRGLAPYSTDLIKGAAGLSNQPLVSPNAALTDLLGGQVNTAYLDPVMKAMTDSATDNFQRRVLPGLRAGQIQNQVGGSTRGDIAAGLATSDLTNQLSRQAASLYGNAYQQAQQMRGPAAQLAESQRAGRAGELSRLGIGGLQTGLTGAGQYQNALTSGLMNYPTVLGAPLGLNQSLMDVGGARQGQQQRAIEGDMARHQFEQNRPAAKLQQLNQLVSGNYGENTIATAPDPQTDWAGLGMGLLGTALGGVTYSNPTGRAAPEGSLFGGNWGWNNYRGTGGFGQ